MLSGTMAVTMAITVAVTMLVSGAAFVRDGQRPRDVNQGEPRSRTRTTERQRTENGHTRRDTWTDRGDQYPGRARDPGSHGQT